MWSRGTSFDGTYHLLISPFNSTPCSLPSRSSDSSTGLEKYLDEHDSVFKFDFVRCRDLFCQGYTSISAVYIGAIPFSFM